MGNYTSRSWAAWAEHRQRHLNQEATNHFDFLGLPPEVQTMIAGWLCPHCSFADWEIASTEEAKELQRDLGNLALCSSRMREVANCHRFHSFVMTSDPAFRDRPLWPTLPFGEEEIAIAHRYNNKALVELLERLLNYGQLRQNLKFLCLRNFTISFKAGINKRTLRRLINGSREFDLPVPGFVPALLALPNHTRDDAPWSTEHSYWLEGELWIEGVMAGLRSMEFDIWLVRLLLLKLAPNIERLMIDPGLAARTFALNPPAAIFSSVSTLGIPESGGISLMGPSLRRVSMQSLLSSFPNLRAFQNDERSLVWHPAPEISDGSRPLGPHLRRLVLASEQPARLQYVARMLQEFPSLEWLYFHRRSGRFIGWSDDEFSNANVFDAVHQNLRVLKYSSSLVTQYISPEGRRVEVDSFEEPHFTDVPHFRGFLVLERLEIDQALLGRMAEPGDYANSPHGPQFPDLDWKLPESLCRLTIRFVYDWPTLAAQLVPLAIAKRTGGQFPLLKDIFIVITDITTVQYTGAWPPEIPLRRSYEPIVVSTGVLLREAGIKLSVSTEEIGPRPAGLDDDPGDSEISIPIVFSGHEFPSP